MSKSIFVICFVLFSASMNINKGYCERGARQTTIGEGLSDSKVQAGTEVVRASAGSGLDDIGVLISEEGSAEGPMSFDVDSSGKIYILDQVNSRIQVFENGVRTRTIPAARTYSDIDLSAQGRIFLLERDNWAIVASIDNAGNLISRTALAGVGITEANSVRVINSRGDGVWANLISHSVRVTNAEGRPNADRVIVDGSYSLDGRYLIKCKVVGEVTVSMKRSKAGSVHWETYTVVFDKAIGHLTGLYTDNVNKIYLGAYLIEAGVSSEVVVVLGSNGQEQRRILMPPATDGPEMNRTLRVTPDGTIYQLALDENSVVVRRYAP